MRTLVAGAGSSGFLLGALARPTWQTSVERAQVLSGVVSYAPESASPIYLGHGWTIVDQVAALLLSLGVSEHTLSVVISGVLTALCFTAVGMCTFAVCRNAYWGIAAALAVYFSGLPVILGMNAPIEFAGTPDTYAVAGLAWVLLTIALVSMQHSPGAGIFLGLAPAVHLEMGIVCWFITLVAFAWTRREASAWLRSAWNPLAAGLSITLVSFLLHLLWIWSAAPGVDSAVAWTGIWGWREFFDAHDRTASLTLPAILMLLGATVAAFGIIRLSQEDNSGPSRFLLQAAITASTLTLFGAAVSQSSGTAGPAFLLTLLPKRIFLLTNLIFTATLIGLLGRHSSIWSRGIALTVSLLLTMDSPRMAAYGLIGGGFAFMLWKGVSHSMPSLRSAKGTQALTLLLAASVAGLTLRGISIHIRSAIEYRNAMSDSTNNIVLAATSTMNGPVAVGTQCCAFTQLRTRKPLLVPIQALGRILYAFQSVAATQDALKAVYGVDVPDPPDILQRSDYGVDLTPVSKPLWEARELEEWQALAAEFGFSAVLANPDWNLQLPEVARDEENALYEIPSP